MTALKYWLRLKHDTNSPLLRNALREAFESKSAWSLGINDIVETYRLRIFETNSRKDNLKLTFSAIKKLLEEDYLNTVKIKSASNPGLLGYLYNHSDNNYAHKEYLTHIENPTHRITVTKLRTSTHCLATANDQFKTDIASNKKFVCKLCSSGLPEDANHLILHCQHPKLIEPRQRLLKLIPQGLQAHPKILTLSLLNCSFQNVSTKNLQNIYKALHSLYKIRENL